MERQKCRCREPQCSGFIGGEVSLGKTYLCTDFDRICFESLVQHEILCRKLKEEMIDILYLYSRHRPTINK